jgi:hypothetical protein
MLRSTPVGRSVSSAQAVLTGLFPAASPTTTAPALAGTEDPHVIRLNRGPQWMVYSEIFALFVCDVRSFLDASAISFDKTIVLRTHVTVLVINTEAKCFVVCFSVTRR